MFCPISVSAKSYPCSFYVHPVALRASAALANTTQAPDLYATDSLYSVPLDTDHINRMRRKCWMEYGCAGHSIPQQCTRSLKFKVERKNLISEERGLGRSSGFSSLGEAWELGHRYLLPAASRLF